MRALLSTGPLCGHFFPWVPLAWALRAAGHEVRIAAPADFTPVITAAGLPAVSTAPDTPFERFMFQDRAGNKVAPSTDPDRTQRLVHSGRAWGRLASRTLGGTLEVLDSWRPDVVISEATEYAGPLAAASRGVPLVGLEWLSALPAYRVGAADELGPELEQLGLGELPVPAETLTVRPDAEQGHSMRYVPYSGKAVQPEWVSSARVRPRICLTVGSMLPTVGRLDFPGKLFGLMSALTGRGLEVVVAVDESVARRWDPLPPLVPAAGWLPLELVTPACDVVINHGGMGSVLTAAANGVPQLALPQTADQFANADWLASTGAGLSLPPDGADTEAVLQACGELLAEPARRTGAAALAARIAAQPTPAELVPVLEQLVS